MRLCRANLSLFLSSVLFGHHALAHIVHTVTVGLEGSFFNPSVIAAQQFDIVSFVFAGDAHGVVQSDKDAPCLPKQGGFNSGIAGRRGNWSDTPPTWDLLIDDATQPIWFFCPNTQPSSHCNSGMVGVINPPSSVEYTDFVNLATIYTATPTPTTSVTLSGVGAHATNSPAVALASTSNIPSSLLSSIFASPSSSLPIPATTPQAAQTTSPSPSKSSNAGAIAGGVVGGIAAMIILIVVAFFGRQYMKRSRRESRTFFDYHAPTPVMSEQEQTGMMSSHHHHRVNSVEQPSTITSAPSHQSQERGGRLFMMP